MARTNSGAITLTRDLAFASGWDAGNAQMRKANRVKWNDDDASLAARTTNRLLTYVPFEHGGLQGLPTQIIADLIADLIAA
jgi:hypothetical protein